MFPILSICGFPPPNNSPQPAAAKKLLNITDRMIQVIGIIGAVGLVAGFITLGLFVAHLIYPRCPIIHPAIPVGVTLGSIILTLLAIKIVILCQKHISKKYQYDLTTYYKSTLIPRKPKLKPDDPNKPPGGASNASSNSHTKPDSLEDDATNEDSED